MSAREPQSGRAWALSIRAIPSRSCATCAWLKAGPKAEQFHAGVVDALKEGAAVPLARLYDELRRRFKYPLTYSGLRCHWDHVKRSVKGG